MNRDRGKAGGRRTAAPALALASLAAAALILSGSWALAGPWPDTSERPVQPVAQPTLQARLAETGVNPEDGFRFVAFGDQRALADGEWQTLMDRIQEVAARDSTVLVMLDTGDIVLNGEYTDQFGMLAGILARVPQLPYWVGVGNHELGDNEMGGGEDPSARGYTATFLGPLDPGIAPDRLYYAKQVGGVRFLFLDSSDLVDPDAAPERTRAQIAWLDGELARPREGARVVCMHHPFLQSSRKHGSQARWLWSHEFEGRTLPDRFLDGGVDLVLVGHTHTYERFRIRRDDGRDLVLVNLSGRPRNSFLWFGSRSRRAHDLRGHERDALARAEFRGLDRWTVTQEDVMQAKDEADQFGLFTVDGEGGITLRVAFLDGDHAVRWTPEARVVP